MGCKGKAKLVEEIEKEYERKGFGKKRSESIAEATVWGKHKRR